MGGIMSAGGMVVSLSKSGAKVDLNRSKAAVVKLGSMFQARNKFVMKP